MFSYWEQQSYFSKQDLIIIGSGFTGLWSAIALAKKNPGSRITILDAGILPAGASTKNAGFSCFGSPSELIGDAATYGEDAMWNLVERRFKGLKKIREFFPEYLIDYNPCGGYECLQENTYANVAAKLDWLNHGLQKITGQEQTFVFTDEKLSNQGLHGFYGLVENKLEGTLDPVKLVRELYKLAISYGVQFFNQSTFIRYEKKNGILEVHTANGLLLQAGKLLFCTNAFTKSLLPILDIEPERGQVCITDPIPNLKLNGCFHFDAGFYYFRNAGNRILIGGGRNKDFENEHTSEFGTNALIQNELYHFIQRHILPDTPFSITNSWSGIMAFGQEKKPIVQQLEEGIFCAVRMSGIGVALAPVVADEVVAIMDW